VVECAAFLYNIVLQDNIFDRWRWLLDPIHGYTIKGTYHFLTTTETPTDRSLYVDVWHKQAPLKVSLFAWRLFRNTLPTKDNLVRRHVLHLADNVCVGGCGSQETANHLFFDCRTFSSIWSYVFQWLDISFVAPLTARDHFYKFRHLPGLPRSLHSFFQLIWFACVWTIWKERNCTVFST